MSNEFVTQIHGRDYMMVAGRVQQALADHTAEGDQLEIRTELLGDYTVRATIHSRRGGVDRTANGHAESHPRDGGQNPEDTNPLEVAETSAVGRALALLGYGLIAGIASAEEVVTAEGRRDNGGRADGAASDAAKAPSGSSAIPCPKCLEAGRTGVLKFVKEGVRGDGASYRLWCCSLRKYSKEKGVHGECDYQRWQDPEPTEASGAAEDDTPPIDETPPPPAADEGEQRTRLIVLIRRAAEERLISQDASLMDNHDLLNKKMNVIVGEEIRRLVGSVKVLTDLTTAQMAQLLTNLGGDPMAGQ